MIESSIESKKAESYMLFSNDVLGILAFTLGATALGFEHPEPFARIFLAVILLWLFSKQSPITKRYFSNFKKLADQLILMWNLKIYLIGCTFLFLIAIGAITEKGIYVLFGYSI